MERDWYPHLQRRAVRRLRYAVRPIIVNALLFTVFTALVGGLSKFTHPSGTIDGVVYWIIFFWSLLLAAHTGYAYFQSGARASRRDAIIEEEIRDMNDIVALAPDTMIDLHLRLSDGFRVETGPLRRLMALAAGNLLLWPVMLMLLTTVRWVILPGAATSVSLSNLFNGVLVAAIAGSLILGVTLLPLPRLKSGPEPSDAYESLRGKYGAKRKNEALAVSETADRYSLSDDGELTVEADIEARLARKG